MFWRLLFVCEDNNDFQSITYNREIGYFCNKSYLLIIVILIICTSFEHVTFTERANQVFKTCAQSNFVKDFAIKCAQITFFAASIIPGDPELIQLAYQEEEHKAKAIMDEMNDFISKNQASKIKIYRSVAK